MNQPFTAVYSLYSVLIVTFFLVMSPYLAWQAVRHRKYIGSLRQRLGYLPISFNLDGEESIWIHAVSVGEVLTARALLPQLKERYPRLRLFLSTTTMTGQQIARNSLQYVDEVFYFPFDLGFVVNRTLRLVKPRLFIMMETEIWPNLLRACHRTGVRTVLVNGRISSRSYPRYRLARPFFRRVLAHVDRFCMQGEESARRIIEIGADPDKVVVTGSLKFDSLDLPGAATAADRGRNRVLRYFRISTDRPVIIAASTLKGEEEPVFEAFQRIRARVPDTLLVIAPRKPERFDEVEQQARRAGWKTARRSELPVDAEPRQDVVVLDTHRRAGAALSDRHGGLRRRQPRRRRRPQHPRAGRLRQGDRLRPPHAELRRDRARRSSRTTPRSRSSPARELEHALLGLLNDPVRRARLGAAARALVEANRGARGKTMTAIARVLPPQDSGNVRPFRVVH